MTQITLGRLTCFDYLCGMLLRKAVLNILKLIFFWVVVFDIQRIIFSIHNFGKFKEVGFIEWLGAFRYSIRLDLASAAFLSLIPLLLLTVHFTINSKWSRKAFFWILFAEIIIVSLIHGGEINAYTEWNHKLTTRVFNHLFHPDEVFRTADYSMTFWFFLYALIEIASGIFIAKRFFELKETSAPKKWYWNSLISIGLFIIPGSIFAVLGRGGFQQIPINIDSAYYSKNYVANDLSVNSFYFFAKSYLLYTRSQTGVQFPLIEEKKAKEILGDFYLSENNNETRIFQNERPNIVFVILESWTANAVGVLAPDKGATPYFDKLSKEGLLFTKIYATGWTSEVGNSSIFSGYPALPEVFISMQPDKHRKLPCLNQDLKKAGYSSHYMFSGDLKYGNIGGYFIDHHFDEVLDEKDFPKHLKKGKLNYFDEDLFHFLTEKIDDTKEPFMHCAFTGSTHSPYDHPRRGIKKWDGTESDFMTSVAYADKCLYKFLKDSKSKKWFENTIFIFVADHGHASPAIQNPNLTSFFHIPLLIWGKPLKKEFRGKQINHLGSQTDIAKTLLTQMNLPSSKYIWSKDLLNPKSPEFALHTITRGYGWVTPEGNFSYQMDAKIYPDQTYQRVDLKKQKSRCHSFMTLLYKEYLNL